MLDDPADPDHGGVDDLAPDSVLSATAWCVLRKQPNEYLAYNSHTDELHLLSPSAYYIYLLCDGLNTVQDIQGMMPAATRHAVRPLLAGLVRRGLLAENGRHRREAAAS